MTDRKRTKEELLKTLRREIFAAEIKVILDKELGRTTSPTVKKLAELKLPPFTETQPEEVEVVPVRVRIRRNGRHGSGLSGRYISAKSRSAGSKAL